VDLPLPLAADAVWLDSPVGRIALYSATPGPLRSAESDAPASDGFSNLVAKAVPMLLVHSINASGTAAEMAPLFEYYRETRPVYALDLPGFGLSDRPDRIYTPRVMTHALIEALKHIAAQHGGAAVDVVALSLSGEYAVRAQAEVPQRIRRLALISPTGFNGKPRRYGPPGSTLGMPRLHGLLAQPLWSDALYRGLTRPGVIRYFLQRSWGSKFIDEALLRYDVLTTRQIGAKNAPLFFLSGYLFSRDINTLYEAVNCPVWVSMATRGDFTDYRGRYTVEGRDNWQFHPVDGGALPYFENLAAFVALLDPFLAGH
jgi:pimeloyl-ACP methyl ester carboxylesterase